LILSGNFQLRRLPLSKASAGCTSPVPHLTAEHRCSENRSRHIHLKQNHSEGLLRYSGPADRHRSHEHRIQTVLQLGPLMRERRSRR